jgi:hypothetical protein
MVRDMSLIEHRWVRIMCDYEASGVWSKDGMPSDIDGLPVAMDLRTQITDWQRLYASKDSSLLVHDWVHWRTFRDTGLALAVQVKWQLPDWTVVYHDELEFERTMTTTVRPRALFEYEVRQTCRETEELRLAVAIEQSGLGQCPRWWCRRPRAEPPA